METNKKNVIVIMNFTHVYEQENFFKNINYQLVDCTDLNGTDCYCDLESQQQLKKRIAPFPIEGIHFIDSGNYHYMTKLWTDRIHEPFSLIVFDHHPDMKPTLFDELLSCGCWVKEMLENNLFLRKVVIIGASESLTAKISSNYNGRLKFYGEKKLSQEEGWKEFSKGYLTEPVYLSIDKDVLDTTTAVTNWDQGSLTLSELRDLLYIIFRKERIIGVDICGECPDSLSIFNEQDIAKVNSKTNRELLSIFLAERYKQATE